ncbi:FAFR349Wp [Eremothecium gossypii FDAG1]|nr:FAFR349Wp [Eremothecium gossypii FDAG1]
MGPGQLWKLALLAQLVARGLAQVNFEFSTESFSYYGCYEVAALKGSLRYDGQSIFNTKDLCIKNCEKAALAVVKEKECYCGDSASVLSGLTAAGEDKCTSKCPILGATCGGPSAYSVYVNDKHQKDISDEPKSPSSTTAQTSSEAAHTSSSTKTTTSSTAAPTTLASTQPSTTSTSTSSTSSQTTTVAPATTENTPTTSVTQPPNPQTTVSYSVTTRVSEGSTIISTAEPVTRTITGSAPSSTSSAPEHSTSDAPKKNSKSLSGGAIAGIVLGSLALVAIFIALAVFIMVNRDRDDVSSEPDLEEKRFHQPYSFGDQDPLPLNYTDPSSTSNSRHQTRSTSEQSAHHALFADQAPVAHYQEAGLGRPRLSNSSLPDVTANRPLRIANPDKD